jgi:cytoskeletal protein RodZ
MMASGSDLPPGDYLRQLREAKAISLDEMAQITRVSVRQLAALESGSVRELPAPVFVKGFVRAYCQALGESPDEALKRYQDVLGERAAAEEQPPAAPRGPVFTAGPVLISLALLLVFGSALLAMNLGLRRGSNAVVSAPVPVPNVTPPPAAPSTPVRSVSAPAEGASGQRLFVKAIEPTWIRVQADDGRVVEELLTPGTTREWTAQRRFLLTVGNAGGIEMQLNGQPMPPLGARGVVIRQLALPQAAAAGS